MWSPSARRRGGAQVVEPIARQFAAITLHSSFSARGQDAAVVAALCGTLDELRGTRTFHALVRNEDLLFSLVAVLIAVPLNVFADYCMQVGLQQKTAARFMPIAQTVNNVVAVAGGIVIFGQRAARWHFYLAGIAMGLAGLFLLARFKHPSEHSVKSGK